MTSQSLPSKNSGDHEPMVASWDQIQNRLPSQVLDLEAWFDEQIELLIARHDRFITPKSAKVDWRQQSR